MKFYYTGADDYGSEQREPALSLGGCISSSSIPNGGVNNLFGDISLFGLDNAEKDTFEMIGIVLKNELPVNNVEDILLYLNYSEDSILEYEVAIVEVSEVDGSFSIEKISNSRSLPYYVTEFYSPNSQLEEINIGNLANGKYLGIWIKRLISADAKLSDNEALCSSFLANGEVSPIYKDKTALNLSWTEVAP